MKSDLLSAYQTNGQSFVFLPKHHWYSSRMDEDDKMKIVVFGSSTCLPDSAQYREAEELGRGLAESGFGVVTGGYGGTMEAVSKGAATVKTVPVRPNIYLLFRSP